MMMYEKLGELVIEEEKKPNLTTAEQTIIDLQKKIIKTRLQGGTGINSQADIIVTGFEVILFKEMYSKL